MTVVPPEIPFVNPSVNNKSGRRNSGLRIVVFVFVVVALLCVSAALALKIKSNSLITKVPVVELPGMHGAVIVAMERARVRLAKTPRSGDAWGHYGMLLMQHDRPKEALTCFDEAIRLDSANAKWYYFSGVILEQTDLRKALQQHRFGLKLNGDIIPMMLRMSTISITLGEFRSAAEMLQLVRERSPETAETWVQLVRLERLRGRPGDAAQWLAIARKSKVVSAELLRESAIAELQYGNTDLAKQLLDEANGAPRIIPAHDAWMEELQKLDVSGNVFSSRADQLQASGKIDEAAKALESLAMRFPERSRPALNYALFLRDQGRLEEAVRSINSLVEQFPEDPLLRFHQAVLKAQFGSSPVDVMQALNEALRLKPDYGTARAGLADMLSLQGRHAEAFEHYAQAVTDSPADPWIRLGFASALIAQGRKAPANAQLQQLDSLLTPQQIPEQQEVAKLRLKLSQMTHYETEPSNPVP